MPDQAASLRAFASQQGVKQPVEVDKAKLWDDFKALLKVRAYETFVNGGKSERRQSAIQASRILAEMETMEQAETFARVRAEFKGGES